MQFTGIGVVFNPKKGKAIVSFNRTDIYETNDDQEIEILKACPNCECISEESHEQPKPKRKRRTKTEIEAEKIETVEAEEIVIEEDKEESED